MNKSLALPHLVLLLCLAVFAFATNSLAYKKDGLLRVYLLDVGQGDSIFIETPDGMQVLIDGGPGEAVIKELGEVMPFYDRTIDVVILSHPHADHVSGLVEVLERYEVGFVVVSDIKYSSSEFLAWQNAINREGAQIIEALAGKEIFLNENTALKILYPLEPQNGRETKDPNNDSVVVMIDYFDFEMLLTGDMEGKQEREILSYGMDIDADLFKVGHQGSKTSTTEPFLSAVSPLAGLISVGAGNRFGHPHKEVIDRLENSSIPYYRTDTNGRIEVRSDGTSFSIHTEK